ncbi:hypothetical protein FRX31_015429 [Thalictrum thalictroides]|uniref:Uncharacterized protein n=1 Tax=Thalictrum thalictroides TaxID=46969 RepID=A0A7J6WDD2_THATH|nr:hypothetical protein FRX31_015429 [Thalictrum thalictroides]
MSKRFIEYIQQKPIDWEPAPQDEYVCGFLFYLKGMAFFRTADNSIPLGWLAVVKDIGEMGRYDRG